MPLENVELVPVKCPNCNADMQIPETLDKVHCLYCGSQFLISKKKASTTMGDEGKIENYVKLVILEVRNGNQAKAKEYVDKARELNLEKAEEILKKHSDEIYEGYFSIFKILCDKFERTSKPFMSVWDEHPDYAAINNWESQMKGIETAFNNAMIFNSTDSRAIIHSMYANAIKRYAKPYPISMSATKNKLYSNARAEFNRVLEIDPTNEEAKEGLIGLGGSCPSCRGKGDCIYCKGSGKCGKCKGRGKVVPLFGKPIKCDKCGGTGTCKTCEGGKICSYCKGKGLAG